ncbi:hypothetical protein FDP41_010536 [Naegleria fowleri]|uniref:Uncharacterized protein n=1 Tax=Naegleria fowleri TaxID=5763 RepID=A0A6A5C8J8_NAEFO|nr:uncharacterized protein FDP41_010536 [Naegleria fowleri]KAF0983471.1 hypothetical protein FDP41_010536 [Naegleria fowleri]
MVSARALERAILNSNMEYSSIRVGRMTIPQQHGNVSSSEAVAPSSSHHHHHPLATNNILHNTQPPPSSVSNSSMLGNHDRPPPPPPTLNDGEGGEGNNNSHGFLHTMVNDLESNESFVEFFEVFQKQALVMIMNQIPNSRTPISTHSSKTLGELIFDMLQLYVKFKASKVMMNEIFRILNALLPDTCKLPFNVNTLLKKIINVSKQYQKVYHCCDQVCEASNHYCSKCGMDCSNSFFWSKSIETCTSEMVDLIGLRNFKAHCTVQPSIDEINDCIDSIEYERVVRGWKEPDAVCITLIGGGDSGSVSKSSRKSVLPLVAWITELPLQYRYSFPLTMLLAYSNKPIPFNTLLDRFISELLILNQGKECKTEQGVIYRLKARLFTFLVDLDACYDLLCMTNHAGTSSCRWCKKNGRKIQDRTIYSSGGNEQERVWSEIVANYKLMLKGEIQQFDGVKGLSILVRLPYFTWTTQIACDLLHNLLEGLCAKLLNFIKNKYNIDTINNKLYEIKTPSFYHRRVRGLDELSYFKAIEYYIIFSYCIEVFQDEISDNHYHILNRLSTFIRTIIHPVVRSLEVLYSMKKEIFEILQAIETDFNIIILTLASHTVVHFPL